MNPDYTTGDYIISYAFFTVIVAMFSAVAAMMNEKENKKEARIYALVFLASPLWPVMLAGVVIVFTGAVLALFFHALGSIKRVLINE